jgi:large subunit ribosomal protein L7/L12
MGTFTDVMGQAAPKILKEGAVKDEAEKIKATMEGLGAKVEVD